MKETCIKICVFMSTYNGETYIAEQIESILAQQDVEVFLSIRDDGSTDGTIGILKKYEDRKNVSIIYGANIGVGNSFFELLKKESDFQYYAFADQDDVWDYDKLHTAVRFIERYDSDSKEAILYCCANRHIDSKGNVMSVQNIIGYPYETLVQALVGGGKKHAHVMCGAHGATCVFNHSLRNYAAIYTPDFVKFGLYHDGWIHRLCLALEGKIIFDPNQHLSYRIHDKNVWARLPQKQNLWTKINSRIMKNVDGFQSNIAKEILKGYSAYLIPENKELLETIAYYRERKLGKWKLIFSPKFNNTDWKQRFIFIVRVLINNL